MILVVSATAGRYGRAETNEEPRPGVEERPASSPSHRVPRPGRVSKLASGCPSAESGGPGNPTGTTCVRYAVH